MKKPAVSVLVTCFVLAGGGWLRAQASAAKPFPWPPGKRAALSLSFDDARPSQVDAGLPLFERHGVRVTFYVSPGRINDRLEGWKKAAAAGHEIANHSLLHPCSGNFPWSRGKALEEYTLERMRREMLDANTAVRELLGTTPRTFGYPCGQKFVGRGLTLKSYVPLVAELFLAGRGYMDEAPNDPWFCDPAQLMAIPCDNLQFPAVKAFIDQSIQNGHWLILAGHDIGESDARQTTRSSMLDELMRYAGDPSRGIWVDTIAKVADYISSHRQPSFVPEP